MNTFLPSSAIMYTSAYRLAKAHIIWSVYTVCILPYNSVDI